MLWHFVLSFAMAFLAVLLIPINPREYARTSNHQTEFCL
jgi:hypothetical protein